MALNGPFTVLVQRPGTTLTEAMSEMRVWLDHHQIELVDFGIAETNVSGTAFRLRFRRSAEASLCSLAFPSPRPMDAHEVVAHGMDRDRVPVVLGDLDDHLP